MESNLVPTIPARPSVALSLLKLIRTVTSPVSLSYCNKPEDLFQSWYGLVPLGRTMACYTMTEIQAM
jgi:hypothetical protein